MSFDVHPSTVSPWPNTDSLIGMDVNLQAAQRGDSAARGAERSASAGTHCWAALCFELTCRCDSFFNISIRETKQLAHLFDIHFLGYVEGAIPAGKRDQARARDEIRASGRKVEFGERKKGGGRHGFPPDADHYSRADSGPTVCMDWPFARSTRQWGQALQHTPTAGPRVGRGRGLVDELKWYAQGSPDYALQVGLGAYDAFGGEAAAIRGC